MPSTCCVFKCTNRASRNSNLSFYRFPKVVDRLCNEYKIILQRRRMAWLGALKRKGVSLKQLDTFRVCSQHFVSGKPADFRQIHHPDWIPSVNMGYPTLIRAVKQFEKPLEKKFKNRKVHVDEGVSLDIPLSLKVPIEEVDESDSKQMRRNSEVHESHDYKLELFKHEKNCSLKPTIPYIIIRPG